MSVWDAFRYSFLITRGHGLRLCFQIVAVAAILSIVLGLYAAIGSGYQAGEQAIDGEFSDKAVKFDLRKGDNDAYFTQEEACQIALTLPKERYACDILCGGIIKTIYGSLPGIRLIFTNELEEQTVKLSFGLLQWIFEFGLSEREIGNLLLNGVELCNTTNDLSVKVVGDYIGSVEGEQEKIVYLSLNQGMQSGLLRTNWLTYVGRKVGGNDEGVLLGTQKELTRLLPDTEVLCDYLRQKENLRLPLWLYGGILTFLVGLIMGYLILINANLLMLSLEERRELFAVMLTAGASRGDFVKVSCCEFSIATSVSFALAAVVTVASQSLITRLADRMYTVFADIYRQGTIAVEFRFPYLAALLVFVLFTLISIALYAIKLARHLSELKANMPGGTEN